MISYYKIGLSALVIIVLSLTNLVVLYLLVASPPIHWWFEIAPEAGPSSVYVPGTMTIICQWKWCYYYHVTPSGCVIHPSFVLNWFVLLLTTTLLSHLSHLSRPNKCSHNIWYHRSNLYGTYNIIFSCDNSRKWILWILVSFGSLAIHS